MTFPIDRYASFGQAIQAFTTEFHQIQPLHRDQVKQWIQTCDRLQTEFQDHILTVDPDHPAPDHHLPYYIEINKQLKLLAADLTLLQAARAIASWQTRHRQAVQRLTLLAQYCQQLLIA